MAIFGVINSEDVVQQDDKLRIYADKSYISKDEAAVTLVEIEPEAGAGFVDVTGNSDQDWFLDWQYATDGLGKVISLRITTDGAPITFTKTIDVLSEVDDALFSTDEGLFAYESELRNLLPQGKSSWKYVHRKAQTLILDWFEEQNFRAYLNQPITKDSFVDNAQVRKWSESWTLALIYKDLSNSVGDKFDEKMKVYKSMSVDARRRAVFRLDLDGDGEISNGENLNISSIRMSRR